MNFIEICQKCGGKCCINANPPLSQKRIEILLENGVRAEKINFDRYPHPKTKEDSYCIFFEDGKCSIHYIKPETCVAGPFTFDLKDDILEIYIKKEEICPLVKLLKKEPVLYEKQFKLAVESIIRLLKELDREWLNEMLKIDEPEVVKVSDIIVKSMLLSIHNHF